MTASLASAPKRLAALDGLRGIAILLVLIWHYFCCLVGPKSANVWCAVGYRVLNWTWSGVDLFFVLSGFLIGGIIIEKFPATNFWTTFYLRRAARIFPLYYLLVLSFFVAPDTVRAPWLVNGAQPNWSYLFFAQNLFMHNSVGANWLGITWSLAVEEQFYLLLPLLICFTPRRHLRKVLIAMICLAPLARTMLFFSGERFQTYVLLPCRCDSLFLGVLIYLLWRDKAQVNRKVIHALTIMLSLCVAMISLFQRDAWSRFNITAGLTCFGALYAILVWRSVTEPGSMFVRVLESKPLVWCGRISYCAYLTHQLVLGLWFYCIKGAEPGLASAEDAILVFASLATVVIASSISYIVLEKPITIAARRIEYELANPEAKPT